MLCPGDLTYLSDFVCPHHFHWTSCEFCLVANCSNYRVTKLREEICYNLVSILHSTLNVEFLRLRRRVQSSFLTSLFKLYRRYACPLQITVVYKREGYNFLDSKIFCMNPKYYSSLYLVIQLFGNNS